MRRNKGDEERWAVASDRASGGRWLMAMVVVVVVEGRESEGGGERLCVCVGGLLTHVKNGNLFLKLSS